MNALVLAALFTAPALAIDTELASDIAVDSLLADGPPGAFLEIQPRVVLPWAAGTRVRMQQTLHGLPVLGEEIIVSMDLDGTVTRTLGEPLADLSVDPSPDLMAYTAENIAADAALQFSGASEIAWTPRSQLAIVVVDGTSRLVWKVDVGVSAPFSTWSVLVDAHTAALIDVSESTRSAKGNVYPTNPEVSDMVEVELVGLQGLDVLTGQYATVVSCDSWDGQACTAKSNHAVADDNGDFLFEPDQTSADDPMAEVQMYHHVDLVSRYFADRHGVNLGSTEALVNFDMDNAFFGDADGDGRGEIAFGQTTRMDFAYDGDVIYHEFGHAVFGHVVSPGGFFDADEYGIDFAASGLNEGMADAFSMVLTGDPLLGEYAGTGFAPFSKPIRDLSEPLNCPEDLYGESHEDGEVWASLAWQMMQDERIGTDLTSDVMYGALTSWPSDVGWEIAGNSVVEVADDMLAAGTIDSDEHAAILEIGDSSGVVGCGRVIALDDGAAPKQIMFHVGFLGDVNIPVQSQLSLTAGEYATHLEFTVTDFASNTPELGWNLYVRRGEHIVHDLEPVYQDMMRPIPAEYDFVIEGTGDDFTFELDIDDEDNLLEPGATYYFSIASRADGTIGGFAMAEISVEGEVEHDDPPEEVGGCGCQTGPNAGWIVFMGLPLLLRRRS